MSTFTMISAPADPTKKDTVTKLSEKVTGIAEVAAFTLPEFKVSSPVAFPHSAAHCF